LGDNEKTGLEMAPSYSRRMMMPKKIYIAFLCTVVIALVILSTGCATKGGFPVSQCISLLEHNGENFSVKVENDQAGCIKEKSVEFYKTTNCTGELVEHTFEDPEEGFAFASGTRGGCPQLIEVVTQSPACVTLTLKSGRKTKVCW